MLVLNGLSLEEKLHILSDAAKYDAACTSSGVDRQGARGTLGSASACGICHSFAADGRCISLLKILMTNECVFDCKYCINRRSNDVVRAAFTPEEICRLTIEFYRRNYIEGLFLSSGVAGSPDATMERLIETLYLLRNKYRFRGYIHVKGIPGASPDRVERLGFLADRMSVNLELPTGDGLRALAPHKTRQTILRPIRQIQQGMAQDRLLLTDGRGYVPRREEAFALPGLTSAPPLEGTLSLTDNLEMAAGIERSGGQSYRGQQRGQYTLADYGALRRRGDLLAGESARFVPAGQSTQMIIGATPETDYQIMAVAEALYQKFDLKRVFYSAYVGINDDSALPAVGEKPPLMREHRLYQADWLMRFYGFQAGELLSAERPDFNVLLDPKCDWAVRHLEHFPVEVNRADYYTLLRVPGIGVKSARRILQARRSSALDFSDLKKMGVVLKRAHFFITCRGKRMHRIPLEEQVITGCLVDQNRRQNWQMIHGADSYRQLSLFEDGGLDMMPTVEDRMASVSGQL